jgi:Bacterial type III secretion protein (HrpB1_HrpK)
MSRPTRTLARRPFGFDAEQSPVNVEAVVNTTIEKELMMELEGRMIDVEMAQLLVNLALLGSWEGMGIHSDAIFLGATAVFPDLASIQVSHAVTLIASNRYAEALGKLESVCRNYPHHFMAQSAMAMVLKEMGDGRWRPLVRAVVKNGQDSEAVALAQALLQDNEGQAAERTGKAFPSVRFA